MKNIFRKIVLMLLKVMAKKRLKKFKGKIVAVVGSVGKTSTKEAIYTVLNSQFRVKKNEGNLNTDFGLLLTVLDIQSGFSSATKWSWYLLKGFVHSLMRDHSEILLLELGVDKPGDMDFLLSVVKPDVVVMTGISPVHIDDGQFASMEDILKEKIKAVKALKEGGIAIFNVDNNFLKKEYDEFDKTMRVGFGTEKEADYYASNIKSSIEGVSFIFHDGDEKYQVHSSVLGKYQAYVLMPAIVCALRLGMEPEMAIAALEKYVLPPGRMSVIPAINEALILDSSYNSSPIALKEALKVLSEVGDGHRKVAVLGNMNELGSHSKEMHEMIGKQVPGVADILLTVGKDAEFIADKAIERGMNAALVFRFKTATEAAEFFRKEIKKGDVLLVKGSQTRVRLENFVKELMKNPDDAKTLLVRQSKVWQAKL